METEALATTTDVAVEGSADLESEVTTARVSAISAATSATNAALAADVKRISANIWMLLGTHLAPVANDEMIELDNAFAVFSHEEAARDDASFDDASALTPALVDASDWRNIWMMVAQAQPSSVLRRSNVVSREGWISWVERIIAVALSSSSPGEDMSSLHDELHSAQKRLPVLMSKHLQTPSPPIWTNVNKMAYTHERSLPVASVAGWERGFIAILNAGEANEERMKVLAVEEADSDDEDEGGDGEHLVLARPLRYDHHEGEVVVRELSVEEQRAASAAASLAAQAAEASLQATSRAGGVDEAEPVSAMHSASSLIKAAWQAEQFRTDGQAHLKRVAAAYHSSPAYKKKIAARALLEQKVAARSTMKGHMQGLIRHGIRATALLAVSKRIAAQALTLSDAQLLEMRAAFDDPLIDSAVRRARSAIEHARLQAEGRIAREARALEDLKRAVAAKERACFIEALWRGVQHDEAYVARSLSSSFRFLFPAFLYLLTYSSFESITGTRWSVATPL